MSMHTSSARNLPRGGLERLIRANALWKASAICGSSARGIASGYAKLDAELPDEGWPVRGAVEVLSDRFGIGELRLVIPGLAALSRQPRWLVWLDPPYLPYAPGLQALGMDLQRLLLVNAEDKQQAGRSRQRLLWALETSLASGSCSAVLAWPEMQRTFVQDGSRCPDYRLLNNRQLRRLQLAAKSGDCLLLLYRPTLAAREASPAELRIQLAPLAPDALSDHTRIEARIIKRRGRWASKPLVIDFPESLNLVGPSFCGMRTGQPGREDGRRDISHLAAAPQPLHQRPVCVR